jgi:hypothetical protein
MIAKLISYFLKQKNEYETSEIGDASKETIPLCCKEEATWLGIG